MVYERQLNAQPDKPTLIIPRLGIPTNIFAMVSDNKTLTAKDVMQYLQVSENTLLKYEREGIITPDFRLGNRKRYYMSSLEKQIKKLHS